MYETAAFQPSCEVRLGNWLRWRAERSSQFSSIPSLFSCTQGCLPMPRCVGLDNPAALNLLLERFLSASPGRSALMLFKSAGKDLRGDAPETVAGAMSQCLHCAVNPTVRVSLGRKVHQSMNFAQIRNTLFEGKHQSKLRK